MLFLPVIWPELCPQIILKLLPCVTSLDLLVSIVDTIRQYANIWACMDAYTPLLDVLFKFHEETWNWSSKQNQCRPLLCLLVEFLEHRDVTQAAKDRINEDAAALLQVSNLKYRLIHTYIPAEPPTPKHPIAA
jgi:hypothetical protein